VSDSEQELDETPELLEAREGLPRHYRMRADRHYVDQLASRSAADPVRMIQVSELGGQAIDASPALRLLIESIRLHGIVHPLLVRRHDTQYRVVAGHKRLLAAQTLHFTTVPCLVRDLTDAEADALAAADNVRVATSTAGVRSAALPDVGQLLTAHVSGIRGCADLCGPGAGSLNRHALDLLKAHAWRASQLLEALNLIDGGPMAPARERSLASVIDQVIDEFDIESRLSGVTLRAEVQEPLSSAGLNDRQLAAGLAGGLVALLPLLADAIRPTIVIHAANGSGNETVIELVQNCAPVTARVAEHFFDRDRATDHAAVIGALAAKALAEAHGGRAIFEPLPHGSRLAITLKRRS
jgi:ParB-like nuclease domain